MESQATLAPEPVTTVCRDGSLSTTVVEAVAAAKGLDPLDLSPLYRVLDPDVIDAIGETTTVPAPGLELAFSWEGCRVCVRADGEVAVTPLDDDEPER
ncbi:HalOD1 output domain-containing protein [Haloarcula onubensis]|uniref:Halobacterial output domain-containing protein n=1 Tax=Haloarcula onubensis TaxID=2950539 RepID=A0ABU2FKB7_9EURY|nr:HalOD1 output domain-containing protein [Halomicroarcula sp. S3CR25-11]MDS0281204.1 hypothetical protein [Halomicroarcula sp. S3CR25-11]